MLMKEQVFNVKERSKLTNLDINILNEDLSYKNPIIIRNRCMTIFKKEYTIERIIK
ncbi:hypothetical protein BH23THE1_BH23THE1_13010 [soil metagenome]|jgi:uncharacterized protein (DUF1919 family)